MNPPQEPRINDENERREMKQNVLRNWMQRVITADTRTAQKKNRRRLQKKTFIIRLSPLILKTEERTSHSYMGERTKKVFRTRFPLSDVSCPTPAAMVVSVGIGNNPFRLCTPHTAPRRQLYPSPHKPNSNLGGLPMEKKIYQFKPVVIPSPIAHPATMHLHSYNLRQRQTTKK